MNEKTSRLLKCLESAASLLQSENEPFWAGYLNDCHAKISRLDISGVEKMCSAYGGAGSFNDIVIGWDEKMGKINPEISNLFADLSGEIFHLAKYLQNNPGELSAAARQPGLT